MQFNVAGLLKSPTGETRHAAVSGFVLLGDFEMRLVEAVSGSVTLIREPLGVFVSGTLGTRLATACVRCLVPVQQDVEIELTESFRPTVQVPGGPPVGRADDGESDNWIDEFNVIDLTEVVRQAIVLAVPMQVLCRPDCRGLCVMCGADLNEGDCGCQSEPDPRWAALRDLLDGDAQRAGDR